MLHLAAAVHALNSNLALTQMQLLTEELAHDKRISD